MSGAAIFGNYTQSDSPYFDSVFKANIDEQVRNITGEFTSTCFVDQTGITLDEVRKSVKCLKIKKACGSDGVFNEHLIK